MSLPPLPKPMYQRLSDLQSGIDDWYSPSQMQVYGQQCREAALLDAMNATQSFGKTGAVMAEVIRSLK